MLRKALAMVGLMGVLLTSISCRDHSDRSTSASELASTVNATERIVLGDISDDPLEKIDRYQPLADYLATHLAEFGIGEGAVTIAPDIETMAQMMQSGAVDIYFDSLYPAAIVSQQSGAEPILRRWKKGRAEYHTIFFARADSGITSLEDLQGKLIGVEESESTSGYFLPIVYLLKAELNPVEKQRETDTVAMDEVGYVFTGEDENTIQWVGSRKVAAGVIDSHSFSRIPEESRADLVILAETETVARQVAVIAADIDPQLRAALQQLLLELDESSEGKKILTTFEETTQFDLLPPESGWDRIKELYQVFQSR
ncbi:MAG: phosphate/phosphite/phosphonate ABC transporter substrate-binding protein [Pseudanabaenales cyanobacterium]|nr:phosphate/phosphite/phosphonate ABC transporter substrate-binding protein [Pseudanabaenales cyanobacterium]